MFGKLLGKPSEKKKPKAAVVRPAGIKPFAGQKVDAPDLELLDRPQAASAPASAPNGFDPYNTGSFDKRQTWERLSRR